MQTLVDENTDKEVEQRRHQPDSMNPHHPTLLLPLLIIFGLCFILPLLNVIRLSLFDESGFTLSYYADVLQDPFILKVIGRTVRIATVTTIISVVLGYPLGILLAKSRGISRSLLTYAVLAPLLLSGVVRSFGWLILLNRNGLVSDLFGSIGYSRVSNGLLFSETAITIGLVHLYMPMLAIAVSGSAQQVDNRLISAARNLGARPVVVFVRVLLPLTVPGLLAGCLLVFSLSSSAFATPAILGGSTVPVASYLIYQQGLILGDWAAAGALSMLLLVLVAGVSILSVSVGRSYRRK